LKFELQEKLVKVKDECEEAIKTNQILSDQIDSMVEQMSIEKAE